MDLGFSGSNQAVGSAAASALLQQTAQREAAVDAAVAGYDAILTEATDTELEALRERRLQSMKRAAEQRAGWLAQGHGTYSAIGEGQAGGADAAREFFEAAKKSDRLVVHFHRPTTRSCDVLHAHLEKLAPRHPETRFVKIDVGRVATADGADGGGQGATYLVEKLGIVVMPTLLVVLKRQAVHQIRGFDELGRRGEDCSAEALEHVLGGHGALRLPEGAERPEELLDAGGVNDVSVRRSGGGAGRKAAAYGYGYGHGYGSGRRGGAYGGDEDYDSDDE